MCFYMHVFLQLMSCLFDRLLQLAWKKEPEAAVKLIKKALEIDERCDFAYETLGTIEVQRYETIDTHLSHPITLCSPPLPHLLSFSLSLVTFHRRCKATIKEMKKI